MLILTGILLRRTADHLHSILGLVLHPQVHITGPQRAEHQPIHSRAGRTVRLLAPQEILNRVHILRLHDLPLVVHTTAVPLALVAAVVLTVPDHPVQEVQAATPDQAIPAHQEVVRAVRVTRVQAIQVAQEV